MVNGQSKRLMDEQKEAILETFEVRFEKHRNRHPDMEWNKIRETLEARPEKLWSLYGMERTGGEPDVIRYDPETEEYLFVDCSPESPKGRRSAGYDRVPRNREKSSSRNKMRWIWGKPWELTV